MKSFKINKKIGRKNLILSILAFILVMMLTVGITYSWIEDIHQVNYNLGTDGDRIPLNIDNDIAANAVITDTSTGATNYCTDGIIDLSKYFYASGDMHLSECYSNGTDFYFPVKKSDTTGTPTDKNYRKGTYDDVNVNYLSITLKITAQNYDMDFWFTGAPTFKLDGSNNSNLRCSVTTDGKTTVYSNSGTYNTVASETTNASSKTGKSFSNASVTQTTDNQYSTGCSYLLNNNTDDYLFRVEKDRTDPLIVTFKLWLEGSGSGSASLSEINMNITSSVNVRRNITLTDATVSVDGSGDQWMDNNTEALFLAIFRKSGNNYVLVNRYQFFRNTETSWSAGNGNNNSESWSTLHVNVPTIYNGYKTVIYRCQSNWDGGNSDEGVYGYKAWNYWEDSMPTTYTSHNYSVYTKYFGTWKDSSKVARVLFCNYVGWGTLHAYMWNSQADNSAYSAGSGNATYYNEPWPGQKMVKIDNYDGCVSSVYGTYYEKDSFDKLIISSDGWGQSAEQSISDNQPITISGTRHERIFEYVTNHWYLGDVKEGSVWFKCNVWGTWGSNEAQKKMLHSSVNYNDGGEYNDDYYMAATLTDGGTYQVQIYDGSNNRGAQNANASVDLPGDMTLDGSEIFYLNTSSGKGGTNYFKYNTYSKKFYRYKN